VFFRASLHHSRGGNSIDGDTIVTWVRDAPAGSGVAAGERTMRTKFLGPNVHGGVRSSLAPLYKTGRQDIQPSEGKENRPPRTPPGRRDPLAAVIPFTKPQAIAYTYLLSPALILFRAQAPCGSRWKLLGRPKGGRGTVPQALRLLGSTGASPEGPKEDNVLRSRLILGKYRYSSRRNSAQQSGLMALRQTPWGAV
jgi:hypothetical protein